MKKQIILLLFLLPLRFIFSQSNEDCTKTASSVVISGQYDNYTLESCTKELKITTLGENTIIRSITLDKPVGSIKIIASDDYVINLKPQNENDFFDVFSTDRELGGSSELDDKENFIYPNPVDDELNIRLNETILGYTISDSYGVLHLQGNTPTNNTIITTSLPSGLYYLTAETATKTITNQFYKN